MKRIKIKHVDGVTDVIAKVILNKEDINLEYRLDGMTYGRTIDFQEAIKIGIIDCDHPSMLPMLGFENSIIGDFCECCKKEFPFSTSNLISGSAFKTDYTDLDSKNYGK